MAEMFLPGEIEVDQIDRWTEVFDLLKPQPNWKYPIDAKVPLSAAGQQEITDAVVWFCGGRPEVRLSGEHWHVTGAGYYSWVGA